MRLHQLAALFAVFSVAWAISLKEATVKVNKDFFHLGEISTLELKQLSLESTKDKLEFEIHLNDVSKQPQQALITLGDGKGLDVTLFPKFIVDKKILKLSTTASKIPVSIRNLDTIFINLIVADSGSSTNLYKRLGEFVPSEPLKELVPYKQAERIGIKPEIHHIFRQDPSTVSAVIPIAFSGAAVVVLVALLGMWVSSIGQDLYGLVKSTPGTQIVNNVVFLSTLLGFEVVFVRYYLGTSIFTTLFHSFVLGIPALVSGSRAFRFLGYLRKIGKA
ncbi:hypothetical protein PSN45_003104 [Yamadazyma tenuis]|uniref:Ribophorin II C-terminal domain-containing protein n=1 Tax=Candida tenuis (strain ATCC 10573 / BCRC 21748 / CBS 615 / JCM 9827 / NBRC 10315 / NRRL Y-1498 / VKM Y-70) TaxID=590646 RepID=G3AZD8_CANTC|nr:uncharacterized protein CANTEDRAFT_112933 [Yamadazyma tenuis ATCC 10573]EGV66071.1 hypothetical protein CANTEDRAFT_112933 [Yamadazyma tenuis ATCC 10573]WEJ95581.1 hypothetical protein PSN45_003104 [Yamadazyma tenuis]